MSAAEPDPPGPDLAGLACFNLYTGWRRVQAFYKRWFEEGTNPPRMYVLELLRHAGRDGLAVGRLADELVVDPGTISGLLSRMADEGLVVRERDPKNGKRVLCRLTPAGRRTCLRNEERLRDADAALYAEVTPAELRALRRVNDKLSRLLDTP